MGGSQKNSIVINFTTSTLKKLLLTCSLIFFAIYFFYNLKFTSDQPPPYSNYYSGDDQQPLPRHVMIKSFSGVNHRRHHFVSEPLPTAADRIQSPIIQAHGAAATATNLSHIAFGIASSAKLWPRRKSYIKLWWNNPSETRGFVWSDKPVSYDSKEEEASLPPRKVSQKTLNFRYENPHGGRSALRISRIAAEMVRLRMDGVRWYVLGDDDTIFVPENLVRVLSKYDHNQFYYIGTSSESHLQNIVFSYKMAFGGAGFAISARLAEELAVMQDRCMHRYPTLYGSDDRMQACMAELGVPLTKEPGFHQFDVYGSVFGLLAAHPVTPLVSLHHLDIIDPIFPKTNKLQALQKLSGPMGLDSAALAQQSICYDRPNNWTVSVSWGYAVQIFRGEILPREMEVPGRTFYNWYRNTDYKADAFNTRPYSMNMCQKPYVYFLTEARSEPGSNRTVSEYGLNQEAKSKCDWKMEDPSQISNVEVYKIPDPLMWDKAPRRNCCRVLPSQKKGTMVIDVGVCHEGEVIEM